jgi:hypothetical protein
VGGAPFHRRGFSLAGCTRGLLPLFAGRYRRCRHGRLHTARGERRGRHARPLIEPALARHGARVIKHSVNIAARLEASAKPGGVLVSYAVFVSVKDRRLQFEDAGQLSLKNVAEPVRGFHAKLSAPRRARRRDTIGVTPRMQSS